ncbi:hypothetical protein I3760_09G136300 [Carya illinoinensis]|uniref:Uncharacterized protein n=1 Tax=Carya illinoinensis TaxID=32201 RepID=A0A8T1PKR4_CARIL|nr:uncharacterized protein LOC122277521 [Carya illinoinensis]XP_042943461.1 uncharacterized protein LOC122277521 [Carya illinoinensis]KAG2689387.1 hypothetical protein I3760_09G136300 [Carya illinoinensis]KAG6642413.1 hypothetical protein CIPAW_09G139200 [Carya illinoinensis]KAG6642414.1 hypothetical protein CIPAW_09G139200 [Carya illinoinensis]KAG6642415.1 hypothetical protein CIPAW_09G139200 [Carya illinoinensis]
MIGIVIIGNLPDSLEFTMKSALISTNCSHPFDPFCSYTSYQPKNPNLYCVKRFTFPSIVSLNSRYKQSRLVSLCSSYTSGPSNDQLKNRGLEEVSREDLVEDENSQTRWNVEVGSPSVPANVVPAAKLSLSDQAFFLLAFIACTTSVAFTSLVIAAVPTLYAMGRAATSLSKLADTAREELPSTMAAIRLSGMEISDLTLELSDLSQEITDGVTKSAQAVQAAEAGIRQIGTLARQQTISMIQERASLPIISLQPVVAGAAKKTSRAVGRATKTFMNILSRGEHSSENEDDSAIDRVEI